MVNCFSVVGADSTLLGLSWRWVKPNAAVGGSVVVPALEVEPKAKGKAKGKAKAKATNRHDAPRNPDADQQALARALERQAERHRHYKRMIDGLELSSADRERLRARGLTEDQIDLLEAQGFRSLAPGLYPAAAGAIGFEADGTYRGKSGFLIPAIGRAPDGSPQLRGFQLAVAQEEQGQGGKYVWLSKGQEREAPDYMRVLEVQADGTATTDESPLFQFAPEGRLERATAVLTDGALKAAITAARQNCAGFGAPGFNYASSMGQLLASLRRLQLENSELRICLSPDAGDLANANLLRSLLSVTQALQREGLTVTWLDLQQERGKADGIDVDEADALAEREVTPAELLRRATPSALNQAIRSLEGTPLGFHRPEPGELTELPFDLAEPTRYPAGQRLEAVERALAQGIRHILLRDPPGAGKSHWAANLSPDDLRRLGVEKVIIASARHLEQGEEFGLPVLRGRGAGLKRTTDGVPRAMRDRNDLAEGEKQTAEPNCIRLGDLQRYQDRAMGPLLSSLCSTCSAAEACGTIQGGFRYERGLALAAPICVTHPQSLQSNLLSSTASEYEDGPALPATGLVMDDLGPASTIESRVVSLASVEAAMKQSDLPSRSMGEVLRQLHGLLEEGVVEGGARKEGKDYGPAELSQAMARFLQMPREQCRRLCWSDLIDAELAAVNRSKEARVCWIELLQLWQSGQAVAWTSGGDLHFSYWNARLRDTLSRAAWVIWADATAIPDDLAGLIRNDGEALEAAGQRLAVLREDRALGGADITVRQVTGLGGLGYTRSPAQRFMLQLTLAALKGSGRIDTAQTAVIDTKAGLMEGSAEVGAVHLAWMAGSRGSNRAQHVRQLVMIGTPRVNLASAVARFQLLYGEPVDLSQRTVISHEVLQVAGSQPMVCRTVGCADARFRRYYSALAASEVEQGLGRLRGYRREGEQLDVWLLADSPAPFPVQLVPLEELVGPKVIAQVQASAPPQLRQAAKDLAEQGLDPTPEALAAHLGVPVPLVKCRLSSMKCPAWLDSAAFTARHRRAEDAREIARDRLVDAAL